MSLFILRKKGEMTKKYIKDFIQDFIIRQLNI